MIKASVLNALSYIKHKQFGIFELLSNCTRLKARARLEGFDTITYSQPLVWIALACVASVPVRSERNSGSAY